MPKINTILPVDIQEKIATFPESSYGAHKVTVYLADGRVIKNVFVAGNDQVIKVGSSHEISFDTNLVVDVTNET
jgi:hypothetical protein